MSFEEFDQQITDAAEKHHPVYREEAWGQMQRLLNEHLPEQDKKRRRAFLLLPLLFLLVAGGVYWFVSGNNDSKQEGNNTPIASNNPVNKTTGNNINKEQAAPSVTEATTHNSESPETSGNNIHIHSTKAPGISETQNTPVSSLPNSGKDAYSSNNNRYNETYSANKEEAADKINRNRITTNNHIRKQTGVNGKPTAKRNRLPLVTGNKDQEGDEPVKGTEATIPATTVNEEVVVPETMAPQPMPPVTATEQEQQNNINEPAPVKAKNITVKKPRANRFGNNFAVTVAAGSDVSAVHFSDPGKHRWITGAGLQYSFAKRLTIRTGIYQTKKVYSAEPADYGAKIAYTPPGYTLLSVDGDCRVLEIPVTLQYTINPAGKYRLFAAAGATSMFMKTEDYLYNYKTAYGQNRSYPHAVKNENEHLFSSVDFSLGVEHDLGRRLFFRAEPYIRLPLRAVGYGQIKLKSAGLMLTAGFRPFAKK